jgi:hypothetical protein
MVMRLAAQKQDPGSVRYAVETFEAALGMHGFEVAERTALPSGKRLMYDLRRA